MFIITGEHSVNTEDALYYYKAKFDSSEYKDGDTVTLWVDLGFNSWIKERFRLARIDAPERYTVDGKVATQFILDYFADAGEVILRVTGKGKYGRWLAEIYKEDSVSLSDALVQNGLARYVEY